MMSSLGRNRFLTAHPPALIPLKKHDRVNPSKESSSHRRAVMPAWRVLSLVSGLLLFATLGWAQPVKKSPAEEVHRVITVIYLSDIYDLDLNAGSYKVRFLIGFIYDSEDVNFTKTLWIGNAKSFEITDVRRIKKRGRYYETATVSAEMIQQWDITKFPFDCQVLTINIESLATTPIVHQRVRFLADQKASHLDPDLRIPGWQIEDFKIFGGVRSYHLEFEDSELDIEASIPQVTAKVTLQRRGLPLFFSLFTGQLVAFFIAALTYLLDFRGPIIRNRFALAVGAFFAAVANTYNITRYLPITTGFTFTGQFIFGTFTFIGLAVLGTVVCHIYDRSNRHDSAIRFNFWWGLITVLLFLGYLIFLFIGALYG